MYIGKNKTDNDDLILAKSDGTTLEEHIEDLLAIWKELQKSVPFAEKVSGMEDFWKLLFLAIQFHDIGKIHKEFQKKLKKEKNLWENQRHEVYSLPFVDKLCIPEEHKNIIKLTILFHHKTVEELVEYYAIDEEELQFEHRVKWKNKGLKFHPKDFTKNLQYNFSPKALNDFFKNLNYHLKKNGLKISLQTIKLTNIDNLIEKFAKPFYKKETQNNLNSNLKLLLFWGALKICDHLGSGKIKKIYTLKAKDFSFLNKIKSFYYHQKKSFKQKNCILIAPTGSGKTEAAMGWLKNRIAKNQGRTFYILPYTASINAMHKRLSKEIGNNQISNKVGILHGNVIFYLSNLLDSMDLSENSDKNDLRKKLLEQYKNLTNPLTICTPFQILKYFFGIRGFEKGLFFLSGAKLIFDEIHAYDTITFAQLITLIEFLKQYFFCDFMIMTATLPSFMKQILINALELNEKEIIYADSTFMKNLKRHKIEIFDESIFSQINRIVNLVNFTDKKIIVVCNTVRQAQKFYLALKKEGISVEKMVLLHGRFNRIDRSKKEAFLENDKIQVLVGTQTIEVSLDIDYDIMFTEPAPLDALLQRFGRINRKGEKNISPIYVASKGGEYDTFIYPEAIVKRTLNELAKVSEINEEKISEMLDNVYPSWENEEEKNEFENTKRFFSDLLIKLTPFSHNKITEEEFYKQFNNVKVLPAKFCKRYKQLVEDYEFVSAESLLVDINRKLFFKYKNEGKIEPMRIIYSYSKNKKNLQEKFIQLIKLKYEEEIGLTEEDEEYSCFEFL